MAMKIEAGNVSRGEVFRILPENIVVIQEDNGRQANPHTQDEIELLARSLVTNGQQQNITVRRLPNKTVQLVSGYGRHHAASWANANICPDNPLRLTCNVIECNAEEAFVKNLIENGDRAELTPMDHAFNQRRLREVFGWEESRIAEFYKRSVAHLTQMRKLLSLPTELQGKVADGSLPVNAAIVVADLPEGEQIIAVKEATNPDTGKVSAAKVKGKAREAKGKASARVNVDAHTRGSNKEKTISRSMKEVRDFFSDVSDEYLDCAGELASQIMEFITGHIDDQELIDAMRQGCQCKKSGKTAK